ncbi:MAG: electron transport complex subunit RsxD [Gammaproteobacteria bacterium]|nr:electron transport complex subunit RsxD [Gammaproteobacteria bacterium]
MKNLISSPYSHGDSSLQQVMMQVVLALIPAIGIYFWIFGWGIITNIVLSIIFCLGFEAIIMWLRRRPIKSTLFDGSALVTAMLLAITIPPLSPWWIILIGSLAAIVLAKQLYGGLGFNPFNPAMVGFVVLLISFPKEMTQWLAPIESGQQGISLLQSLQIVFGSTGLDALSGATPLDALKSGIRMGETIEEAMAGTPIFGQLSGIGWEWINLAILVGGLWMLWRKTIRWQVPVAMLGSLAAIATLFYLIDPNHYADPLFHIFGGGALLGAFFIATDPVSGATSPKGRIIFGIGVGLFTYIIRSWGGFPDGIAFSILLMNMSAPMIDYYTQPKVFGQKG